MANEIRYNIRCMQEIEVLVPLKGNLNKSIKKLEDQFNSFYFELIHDIYYKVKPRTSLRLRSIDDILDQLTYKQDIYKGKEWIYSDEYETEVDFIGMKKILDKLFDVYVELRIKRYYIDTDNYKIVIDQVKGLGNFLEVERKKKARDIDKAKQEIRDFIKTLDLDLGQELNKGKPELMAEKVVFG